MHLRHCESSNLAWSFQSRETTPRRLSPISGVRWKPELGCAPFIQIFLPSSSSFLFLLAHYRCVQPRRSGREPLARVCRERRESRNECRSGYRIISMEVDSYEPVQAFRALLIFSLLPSATRRRRRAAHSRKRGSATLDQASSRLRLTNDRVRLHRQQILSRLPIKPIVLVISATPRWKSEMEGEGKLGEILRPTIGFYRGGE